MTMEVLLLRDVPKLGHAGDTVRVADGYGRNFLIARHLATVLSDGAKKQSQVLRDARERREQRQSQEASALAQRLHGLTVSFQARSGEKGKLYGSVTAADIAAKLSQAHGVDVDRRKIDLDDPLREIGQFDVPIRFSPLAIAHVTVIVEGVE
jgi:large subunit ribosomal protein L9